MKQFQIHFRSVGTNPRPFGLAAATERYGSEVTKGLNALAVGESCVDCDGDTWTRLPDVGDERLERIATAVLAGLAAVPNNSLQLTPDDVRRLDVESAVKYAQALIAALDATE